MNTVSEAEYPALALRTLCAADAIKLDRVPKEWIGGLLRDYVAAAKALDALKRITVYGKAPMGPLGPVIEVYEPSAGFDPQVYHAILGIATEAGELIEALAEHMFVGLDLDLVNLKEELGDLEWYEALLRDRLKLSPEEIRTANIAKLEARYAKKKFEAEAALNRDHEAERKALGKP